MKRTVKKSENLALSVDEVMKLTKKKKKFNHIVLLYISVVFV